MATYVNDLRLTELATGEGSGSWGTTTNQSLELIGEALGYATQQAFGSDADATTTVADGASDPARAMYYKITSAASLTATRTLTIAPNTISRVMFIENATTGSQSIAISQGSGANVTIATGKTAVVYLDGAGSGAAVVDAMAGVDPGVTDTLAEVLVAGNTTGGTDIAVGTGDDITFADSSKAIFGAGSDLQIYHDGTHSYIDDAGTGDLLIRAENNLFLKRTNSDETYFSGAVNGAVTLFHNNNAKLATTISGVDITGTVTADGVDSQLSGSGGLPVTSGTAQTYGSLRVGATSFNTILDMGSAGASGAWLQASDKTALGTNYPILLNPNGGNVGIGEDTPLQKLHVNSGTGNSAAIFESTDSTSQIWLKDSASSTTYQTGIGCNGDNLLFNNGGEKMRIDASGNVGIGCSPNVSLEVDGGTANGSIARFHNENARYLEISAESDGTYDDAITVFKKNTSVGQFAFRNSTTEYMRINASGNVGIASVPPAWGSAYSALTVGTSGAFWASKAGASLTAMSDNSYLDGSAYKARNTGAGAMFFQSAGTHVWRNFASVSAGATQTSVTAMTLDASGNLGIGTNPIYDLDILDTSETILGVRASDSSGTNVAIRFQDAGTGTGANGLYVGRTSALNYVWTYEAEPILFGTSATERMRIDSSGNVGIGTSSIIGNLNIHGGTGDTASQDAVQTFTRISSTGNRLAAKIRLDNSTTTHADLKFQVKTTASSAESDSYYTDAITIKGNTGNVGIGCSPAQALAVKRSSGDTYVDIARDTQAQGQVALQLSGGTGGTNWIMYQDASSNDLKFFGNSSNRMVLDTSGNVGIGCNPQGNLDIDVGLDTSLGLRSQTGVIVAQYTGAPAVGNRAQIGLGYGNTYTNVSIGAVRTSAAAYGTDDFIIATKSGTADTAPTERLRVDASGNLGIGTSSLAQKLSVSGASGSARLSLERSNANTTGGVGSIQWNALDGHAVAGIVAYGDGNDEGAHIAFNTTSAASSSDVYVSTTERMRIDSSGNVGIGTSAMSSYYAKNLVIAASDEGGITIECAATEKSYLMFADGTTGAAQYAGYIGYDHGVDSLNVVSYGYTNFYIGTSQTEAMQIDASGNLLVGTTSASPSNTNSFLYNVSGKAAVLNHASGTGSGQQFLGLAYNGGYIGSIAQSGTTAVLYNTSSDQRLKENIADADDAGLKIDSIQVRKFDWKADGSHQDYGMVAQELLEVAPEAVHQPEDPEEMMGVDYSKLVPMMLKEIQSLRARIAALES